MKSSEKSNNQKVQNEPLMASSTAQVEDNSRLGQKAKKRFRGMMWSLLLILFCAMALPTGSYLFTINDSYAQESAGADTGSNQRSNFWRAVREGTGGYSAVKGPEANVLINSSGQDWRLQRDAFIEGYAGWILLASVVLILLFFLIRGRITLDDPKSGLVVPRWGMFERIMHWYVAILFVIMAITGLSMLFGRMVLIPVLGSGGYSLWASFSISVHNIIGPFFSLGVLAMLLVWIKNNIFNGTDLKWFASGGGLLNKGHPSAGKANGGEKVWYWIVILLGLVAVCGTGLALIGWAGDLGIIEGTRALMQRLQIVHAVAAVVWVAIFFGHAYIGTIGTEGALEGMTTGHVSVEWAKQHHDKWYEEVKDQANHIDSLDTAKSDGSATV